jgi:formylglycine-generating enzyme required for sulfatase activity
MKKSVSLFVIFLLVTAVWAQNRHALVIGNANYPSPIEKLPNAINDTNDISAALKKLGYEVVLKQNLKDSDMDKEVDAFIARLKNNRNSEGFFWYAGHAINEKGEGYLLPLDVDMGSITRVIKTSLSVTSLSKKLDDIHNKANVLVLDACRTPPKIKDEENEKGRGMGDETYRVLNTVPHVPELIVIYSTAPGTKASDGAAGKRNSPFTEAFLKNINAAEPLTVVASRITRETLNLTKQQQRPYISGSITDEYYSLNPAPVPVNMVRIEGGTFTMGSPSSEAERDSDEIQHRVTVSTFYMSKYQVTQAEYETVMKKNPSYFKGPNLPVENVSWYNAVEYCNALSQREGLAPAYTIDKSRSDPNNKNEYDEFEWLVTRNPNASGYRLPTEAEWEYACRAGTTTPFNTGNNITTSQANYDGNYPYNNNAKGTYLEKTTPVGSFAANQWGLHDMHGNVWEWCWDWYGDYQSGTQTNPPGAVSGADRVMRGGSWSNYAGYIRSAFRDNITPSFRSSDVGFRLVRP